MRGTGQSIFVFWSCAIMAHAAAFTIFAYRFPLPSATVKPQFVFLGAILQSQELIRPSQAQRPDRIDINIATMKVGRTNPEVRWIKKRNPQKPAYTGVMSGGDKKTLKLNPEDLNPAEPNGAPSDDNLGIDTGMPVYVPLKLYSR